MTIRENLMPDQLQTTTGGATVTFNWPNKLKLISSSGSTMRVLPRLQSPSGWKLNGGYVALWVD
jgi:hypothetical protein